MKLEQAKKLIEEQNRQDAENCAAEVRNVFETTISDILKKYGCGMTQEVKGRGNQMEIMNIFFKIKA